MGWNFKNLVVNLFIATFFVTGIWIGMNYILPVTTEFKIILLCDYDKTEWIVRSSLYESGSEPQIFTKENYVDNQEELDQAVEILCNTLKNNISVKREKVNIYTRSFRYIVSEKYLAQTVYQLKYVRFGWRYVLQKS